jgi:multiple sugar transport system ATP-binding protein
VPEAWRAAASGGSGRDGRKVIVGLRPENLRETERPGGGPVATLTGTVEFVEPLGHEVIVHARVGDDLLVAKLDPHRAPQMGDDVAVVAELDALHLFDAETEQRLAA